MIFSHVLYQLSYLALLTALPLTKNPRCGAAARAAGQNAKSESRYFSATVGHESTSRPPRAATDADRLR
jgi:hypothetical protein